MVVNQIFLFVGMTGFEPATTRPPDAYSNRTELHPVPGFACLRVQRYDVFYYCASVLPKIFQKNVFFFNECRKSLFCCFCVLYIRPAVWLGGTIYICSALLICGWGHCGLLPVRLYAEDKCIMGGWKCGCLLCIVPCADVASILQQ